MVSQHLTDELPYPSGIDGDTGAISLYWTDSHSDQSAMFMVLLPQHGGTQIYVGPSVRRAHGSDFRAVSRDSVEALHNLVLRMA